jgi:hypothetical protein
VVSAKACLGCMNSTFEIREMNTHAQIPPASFAKGNTSARLSGKVFRFAFRFGFFFLLCFFHGPQETKNQQTLPRLHELHL